MIESAALIEPGAGDETASSKVAELGQWLQQEQADTIALHMFFQRAEGPHVPEIINITDLPTPNDVIIGKAAVLAAIGEGKQ